MLIDLAGGNADNVINKQRKLTAGTKKEPPMNKDVQFVGVILAPLVETSSVDQDNVQGDNARDL